LAFMLRFSALTCSSDGPVFERLTDAVRAGRRIGSKFAVWQDDEMRAVWAPPAAAQQRRGRERTLAGRNNERRRATLRADESIA
jgi:hypothetical protein